MLHHDPQTWIVFWLHGRELTRITAAEAAWDEPRQTRQLLAFENDCPEDDIMVVTEEG